MFLVSTCLLEIKPSTYNKISMCDFTVRDDSIKSCSGRWRENLFQLTDFTVEANRIDWQINIKRGQEVNATWWRCTLLRSGSLYITCTDMVTTQINDSSQRCNLILNKHIKNSIIRNRCEQNVTLLMCNIELIQKKNIKASTANVQRVRPSRSLFPGVFFKHSVRRGPTYSSPQVLQWLRRRRSRVVWFVLSRTSRLRSSDGLFTHILFIRGVNMSNTEWRLKRSQLKVEVLFPFFTWGRSQKVTSPATPALKLEALCL